MADIEHPQVTVPGAEEVTPEHLFAAEVVEIIGVFAVRDVVEVGGKMYESSVTERIDVESRVSSHRAAYRLRVVPALRNAPAEQKAKQAGALLHEFNPEELAIMWEYGELQRTDLHEPEDDDYVWSPYIITAISTVDSECIEVLNAKTGLDLALSDIAVALHSLRLLHQSYRSEDFSIDVKSVMPSQLKIDRFGHGQFLMTDFPDIYVDPHILPEEQTDESKSAFN
jgi:hypothetical protein